MQVLIDLQACQSESSRRGIGRYSLALANAIVHCDGAHEVSLLLNSAFPSAVTQLRARFGKAIPPERIHVFTTPAHVAELETANAWRTRAAETLREGFV